MGSHISRDGPLHGFRVMVLDITHVFESQPVTFVEEDRKGRFFASCEVVTAEQLHSVDIFRFQFEVIMSQRL